jgi:hypothetical protein
MRNITYLFLSIMLASPLSAVAFGPNNSDYDQCILISLRNSESRQAATSIRDACDALYRNGELLLPREKSYHVCVLQNVQGVRDAFAVNEILHACRRQNQMSLCADEFDRCPVRVGRGNSRDESIHSASSEVSFRVR